MFKYTNTQKEQTMRPTGIINKKEKTVGLEIDFSSSVLSLVEKLLSFLLGSNTDTNLTLFVCILVYCLSSV